MARTITIVGGGLAGLTLGIALRREGVGVDLLEAGHYPRHRVCGEFLSGQGPAILRSLGLEEKLIEAGARRAQTGRLFLGDSELREYALPSPAICLSRHVLDALLAGEFTALGGRPRQETRWRRGPGAVPAGVVLANGRRLRPVERGYRWVGMKAHAQGVRLGSDLEMHSFADGYIGACRLSENLVNLCGLFRLPAERSSVMKGPELLLGPPGSLLRARLEAARVEAGTFCSVAGLSLEAAGFDQEDEVSVGDALTMTPPITGNGMSMALESAAVALAPLLDYARGRAEWGQACGRIVTRCRRRFAWRLRWGALVHRALFCRALAGRTAAVALRNELVWRVLFRLTR